MAIMTYRELKKVQRKNQRQELKTIESHLHPAPEQLNGMEILHRHKGQNIIFTAWKNNNPANNKSLNFHRLTILNDKHFYNTHKSDFDWLASDKTGIRN